METNARAENTGRLTEIKMLRKRNILTISSQKQLLIEIDEKLV
jgi:hypothetical protein